MLDSLKPYPAYKESGVPWLGRVPEHWETRRGKSLFAEAAVPVRESDEIVTCFRDGQVTLRRNRRTTGFMVALKEAGYQGVRKGQLVIHAMDAFAGAVGVSESDGKCTPEYIVCDTRSAATRPAYYASALRVAAQSRFIEIACPAVRERAPRLRYPDFGALLLPAPPPEEQETIVRFLDHEARCVRQLIRVRQKLVKLLEERKQAILDRAVTRGLDPNVRQRPSSLAWLGDIPEHWNVKRLGQIASSFRTGPFGSILHETDYIEGGVPIVNPTHMRGGRIIEDSGRSVPNSVADRLASYQLEEHDLVFSRRGELGRCALVRRREAGWICGTGSLRVRPAYDGIDPEYLILALQHRSVGEYLSLFSVGATMESLNTGILAGIALALPPMGEQQRILNRVQESCLSIDLAVRSANQEISLIRELRAGLIADVVTGKFDVRKVAARLPDETVTPDAAEYDEVGAQAEEDPDGGTEDDSAGIEA